MGRGFTSIIHACILKFKSNIITLHYTGNKFLQPGLEGNKYNNNKSLNHAILKHAVHYVTLQNTELAISQENIQLAQIKIKFFEECTYNTKKYWPYLNDLLLGQEIINLGPAAPVVYLRTFQKRAWHQKSCLPSLTKKVLGFQTS